MFLEPAEINEIRKQIIDGVDTAKKGGVVCDYPDSFTVTRMVGANQVTVTFPIWTDEHKKLK